jgi:glutaminyl-peptide cyclotransferase
MNSLLRTLRSAFLLATAGLLPVALCAQAHPVSGARVMTLTQEFLKAAPKRYIGSPGHAAAEQFLKDHFKPEAAKGNFVADSFSANTPLGMMQMTNYIAKFPGKKDGIIALVSHYETNYPLKDTSFMGANDGACTSALLIALGEYYREHPPQGYSVWLVFDDGEEAIANPPIEPGQWTASNSLYGTRHLAAKWSQDGTAGHVKAVLIADMIGDKDLNIMEETQSTDWLREDLRKAARTTGHSGAIFKTAGAEEDDHLPFLQRGIPTIDIIDVDYGPRTSALPDGYHHTPQDTVDKLSVASLQTSADLFTEMIKLINQR